MNDTPPEEWRPIAGYEGLYEVSNKGRVRSFHSGTAQVLKPFNKTGGYKQVQLCNKGKSTKPQVHHLVLDTFVGPRPAGYECRHLDSNPANNEVSNLKWGTSSENSRDVVEAHHHWNQQKTHCPNGHLLEEPNLLPGQLKKSHRHCVSCSRARSYVWNNPGADFQTESDKYYAAIMAAGTSNVHRRTHCPRGHKLEAPNLTPALLAKGHRNCLACKRAITWVRRHPGVDMQEESDRRYSIIMGTAVE